MRSNTVSDVEMIPYGVRERFENMMNSQSGSSNGQFFNSISESFWKILLFKVLPILAALGFFSFILADFLKTESSELKPNTLVRKLSSLVNYKLPIVVFTTFQPI